MDFNEIITSVDTFNNLNIVNKIDRAVYVDKKKGNQYELDQFNWTMKCRNYRHKMKHISKGFKVKIYDTVDSLENLQDILYKNDVSQPWSRLEKHHKLEKISDYIKTLSFNSSNLKLIKTHVYTKFKKGKLKSSKDVIYDKKECKIINIPIVKDYIKTLN
tara:strand:+ start:741 stop:1220 length:480 start_codon:yes stop_codon:yes gene_type:complete